jgi:hypothetical protein
MKGEKEKNHLVSKNSQRGESEIKRGRRKEETFSFLKTAKVERARSQIIMECTWLKSGMEVNFSILS